MNAVSDITELEVRLKNLKGLAVGQLFMEPFWLMGLNYLMWTVLGYLQGHNKWGLVLHLYGYMSWPNPSRDEGSVAVMKIQWSTFLPPLPVHYFCLQPTQVMLPEKSEVCAGVCVDWGRIDISYCSSMLTPPLHMKENSDWMLRSNIILVILTF